MADFDPSLCGRHAAEIEALRRDNEKIDKRLQEISASIKNIEQCLAEVRGGKKALWTLLGVFMGLGAFVSNLDRLWHFIAHRP